MQQTIATILKHKTPLKQKFLAVLAGSLLATPSWAVDFEVTHWWTSPGESAALREIAQQFESHTGHKWVDGAIAGSGDTARPVMVSRILGGDPMAATQFNHGLQAREMIEEGLMLDITEVAQANIWSEKLNPVWLIESCTVNGKVYCAPLNLHGQTWLWTSLQASQAAGIAPITNWEELKAAAPKLREAGILPLALAGTPSWTMSVFYALLEGVGGTDLYNKVLQQRDAATLQGPALRHVFEELAIARELSAGTNVNDWNLATAKVINGQAAAQIMGDWAMGEFEVAGKVAGTDYDCFVGLSADASLMGGGDAIYFPRNRSKDVTAAQKQLAQLILTPELQLAFNSKKGSMPIINGIDLTNAPVCMQKGLQTLGQGRVIPAPEAMISPNAAGEIGDLIFQFFGSKMSPSDAQQRFASILLSE